MIDYRITTDSTVDLTPERMHELKVPFTQLSYVLDGTQYPDEMTLSSANRMYQKMRAGDSAVTSQPNPDAFIAHWKPILAEGRDILYIGFSSAISGTVNSARLARDQMLEEYPEREIHIVDSLGASSGEGLLVEYAVHLQREGASFHECCKAVEDMKLRVHHWFTVDDLVYLRRTGRVSKASAYFATLLNIKPVLNMDNVGRLVPREKVKGRRAAIKRMYQHLCECIDTKVTDHINISNADCPDDAKYLESLIHEGYPNLPVHIYSVGSVIGSHCGPGTLALFFFGTPRVD